MASATEELSNKIPDQDVPWYTEELQDLTPSARKLLETYSRIPPDQVVSHILAIVSGTLNFPASFKI